MIPKNYFTQQFKGIGYTKSIDGNAIQVRLDLSELGKNIDRAQDALDAQVWADIQKYMPIDTGALIQLTNIVNQSTRGEVYFLPPDSDYGHYQYEGVVYVDPLYGKGAFYDETYGFWSRPGVKKVPSARRLNYQRDTAQPHWDEVAFNNHYDDWVAVVKRAL